MKERLQQIHDEINKAAAKVGRSSKEITLVAVSKTYPVADIEEAISLGCNQFGENRVQELVPKIEAISTPVDWHLIGPLQTNKVKYIIGKTKLIHSLDRISLAQEIERLSAKQNLVTEALIEVNVAKEASKHGIFTQEVLDFVKQLADFKHIKVRGLMTVAPFVEDPEENRYVFRELYDLSVDIQKQKFDNITMDILSMGMSNDYKVAIEEGSTMVRIGTAIFGNRSYT